MAKGKKASGKHYISAGVVGVNRSVSKAVRRGRSAADVYNNKFQAYLEGKNVWFTIDNPNKQQTNKRQIRVRGVDLYGNPKEFGKPKEEKNSSRRAAN